MANAKQVIIQGWLPFNFMDAVQWGGTLTDGDVAFLARVLLGKNGLELRWRVNSKLGEINEHGGRTTWHDFRISGLEALAWPALDRLVDTLVKAGAEIEKARAMDVDDGDAWVDIGNRKETA